MLSFFFNSTEVRLSQQEESYFDQLINMLEQLKPSALWVTFKFCIGVVSGTAVGAVIWNVPGGIIGGLTVFGCGLWLTKKHDRMLATLKQMSEGEKVRIVSVVQGVVGGSSDINEVVKFINNGGSSKLLKALKKNLELPRVQEVKEVHCTLASGP